MLFMRICTGFCGARLGCFRGQLRGTFGINADKFAFAAFIFKFDKAFDQREQSVVLAAAYVVARLPLRSTLASQDVAAEHALSAEFLESKPLSI